MSDPRNNCNICFGGSDCSHFLGALGDDGNKVDSLRVTCFHLFFLGDVFIIINVFIYSWSPSV